MFHFLRRRFMSIRGAKRPETDGPEIKYPRSLSKCQIVTHLWPLLLSCLSICTREASFAAQRGTARIITTHCFAAASGAAVCDLVIQPS